MDGVVQDGAAAVGSATTAAAEGISAAAAPQPHEQLLALLRSGCAEASLRRTFGVKDSEAVVVHRVHKVQLPPAVQRLAVAYGLHQPVRVPSQRHGGAGPSPAKAARQDDGAAAESAATGRSSEGTWRKWGSSGQRPAAAPAAIIGALVAAVAVVPPQEDTKPAADTGEPNADKAAGSGSDSACTKKGKSKRRSAAAAAPAASAAQEGRPAAASVLGVQVHLLVVWVTKEWGQLLQGLEAHLGAAHAIDGTVFLVPDAAQAMAATVRTAVQAAAADAPAHMAAAAALTDAHASAEKATAAAAADAQAAAGSAAGSAKAKLLARRKRKRGAK